jgi:hypothetical protein
VAVFPGTDLLGPCWGLPPSQLLSLRVPPVSSPCRCSRILVLYIIVQHLPTYHDLGEEFKWQSSQGTVPNSWALAWPASQLWSL